MKLFKRILFKLRSNSKFKNLKEEAKEDQSHDCYNPKCENFKLTGKVVNTLLIGMLIH